MALLNLMGVGRAVPCAPSIENQKSKIKNPSPPFRRKYVEQELLEVSAVSIPANPSALALAVKSGAIEKSDLKNTADLISYTLSGARSVWTAPLPALSSVPQSPIENQKSKIHTLLALSRQIRAQLNHL